MVFTTTVANTLKKTLNKIIDDRTEGIESSLLMPKYYNKDSMDEAYIDDLETGGPGLASEKQEGAEIATGSIREGFMTRYIARTFALKMIITQETMEDSKYPEVVRAAKRLKRAMYKTIDIDAANVLVRAFNSAYVGGDGQPLCSNAHTMPHGGTFSNILATPMSPSRQAVISAVSMARKLPGHDGTIEGNEIRAVVFPTEQWAVWSGLLNSTKAPEPGNFNEINVINHDLDIKAIPVKYWTNTTTNYIFLTDAEDGLKFYFRVEPNSRTWVDNDNDVMKYAIRSRWARGWSDARGVIGVNA